MALKSVPLLDLSDYLSNDSEKRNKFIKDLGDAFLQLGFIRLKNFGIDPKIINEAYDASRRFFTKTDEKVKMATHIPDNGGARGYTPFGKEHAKGNAVIDLKEFYHVGRELEDGIYLFYFIFRSSSCKTSTIWEKHLA